MSQVVIRTICDTLEIFELPDPEEPIMQGVYWGRIDQLFTPAYWSVQAWYNKNETNITSFKIGNTIKEEIVACMLGGYGIPAEIGIAAFHRLRDRGLISGKPPSEQLLYTTLREPLKIGESTVRYRFARQRSRFLNEALQRICNEVIPLNDPYLLRDWLIGIPGIGLKTASWITRNWLSTDLVAILDIHVVRAGKIIGIFNPGDSAARNYLEMEKKYLDFAQKIHVQASFLDALIWSNMREAGKVAIRAVDRIIS